MPRKVGPERSHFGGQSGLTTVIVNGQAKYFWTCMHCGFNLGGQAFQNRKARIHLSGNNSLRDGSISMVCSKAPAEVQKQFTELEIESREKIQRTAASRKRCSELLSGSPQLADPSGTAAKLSVDGNPCCRLPNETVTAKWTTRGAKRFSG